MLLEGFETTIAQGIVEEWEQTEYIPHWRTL